MLHFIGIYYHPLYLCYLIDAICLLKIKTSVAEIEKCVQAFFRNAPDRHGGSVARKEKRLREKNVSGGCGTSDVEIKSKKRHVVISESDSEWIVYNSATWLLFQ